MKRTLLTGTAFLVAACGGNVDLGGTSGSSAAGGTSGSAGIGGNGGGSSGAGGTSGSSASGGASGSAGISGTGGGSSGAGGDGGTCGPGSHSCGGVECFPDNEPTACGTTCEPCPNTPHGSAVCTAGTCSAQCAPPYVLASGQCVSPVLRPVAPLSTSVVSTREPTLTWALPAGLTAVHVDVCQDRACAKLLWASDVTGTSIKVGTKLPPGVAFWRLAGIESGIQGPFGPTWELMTTGTHDAPTTTAWGSVPDFNGDGLADIVASWAGVEAFAGSASFPLSAAYAQNDANTFSVCVLNIGDVDGDGYADVAWVGSGGLEVHPGSSGGIEEVASQLIKLPSFSLATGAGDVNGDGYADVIVSEGTSGSSGGIAVLPGTPGGLDTLSKTSTIPDYMGYTTLVPTSLGDVNGDGLADIAVADPGWGGGVGRVYVYYGNAGGIPANPSMTLDSPTGLAHFGSHLSGAGDVNGDGYGDIASYAEGAVYVYDGSGSGIPTLPSTTLAPVGTLKSFDGPVTSAGDVNGDGYTDLVVQASTTVGAGADLYVFAGSASGVAPAPIAQMTNPSRAQNVQPNVDNFGKTIAAVGDVNGDGIGDFVGTDMSAVYLYPGSTAPLSPNPATTIVASSGGIGGVFSVCFQ